MEKNIVKKLNEVLKTLSDDQEEEAKIVNQLMLLLFGREPKELPKQFEVKCFMDNEQIETFLRKKLELDVKEVNLNPITLLVGAPVFLIELN